MMASEIQGFSDIFNKFGSSFVASKDDQDNGSPFQIRSSAFTRFESLPGPFILEDSPPSLKTSSSSRSPSSDDETVSHVGAPVRHLPLFYMEDESSQDSGVGLDEDGLCHRYSRSLVTGTSPFQLGKSSLMSKFDSEEGDDGFTDLLQMPDDDEDVTGSSLKGLEQLLGAPVVCSVQKARQADREAKAPRRQKKGGRRGLFHFPSASGLLENCRSPTTPSFKTKRNTCSEEDDLEMELTPLVKRRKSVTDCSFSEEAATPVQQSDDSTSEAHIKSALERLDDQELIGDSSKPYCLPLIRGKHSDLKAISSETVGKLLDGEYSDIVGDCTIVDSRYPYEFDGGHLRGAINCYTEDAISAEFIKSTHHRQTSASAENKRSIIIFHCEFSSERGPKMSRFLRNMDRDANKEAYPALYYPEVYLMEGGYKAFFGSQDLTLCEPSTYLPMLHEDHRDNLKFFRSKSKSESHIGESKRQTRLRRGFSNLVR